MGARKQIPATQARLGDLVFYAGADGTMTSRERASGWDFGLVVVAANLANGSCSDACA